MKSVAGVDTVNVSLEKGLAAVKLKDGNTATISQLQEAVTKNGFTMKQSFATVAGTIQKAGDKYQLKVSGSNEVFDLEQDAQAAPLAASLADSSILMSGVIPEAAKGKRPTLLRYTKIEVK
jgi:hypothetical protein